MPQALDAIHALHVHVAEDQLWSGLRIIHAGEHPVAVLGTQNVGQPELLQQLDDDLQDERIVIGHQHPQRCDHEAAPSVAN